MASLGDPYRILGLAPGAPLADVKRAYRRLAKANHPDTAGETAIPRFLAIRAAYEAIAGDGAGGGVGRRPGAPSRPWDADADRARATREAWRSRAGRRPGSTDGDGGEATGARERARASGPGRGTAAGGGARGAGTRRRSRPGAGDGRPPDRATPGSTSYDYAEHEPFDPEWSGASWYGQSSGTYWTINPKEYADPRKHGPEYQARGRRRPTAGEAFEPSGPEPASETAADEPLTEAAGAAETAWRPRAYAPPPPPPPSASASASASSSGREARPSAPSAPRPVRGSVDLLDLLPMASGTRARIGLALLAWPPLGLFLTMLLGEVSGCGRFAAGCVETFALGTWVGQVALVVLLVALPALAAIASVGTLAMLAVAIPGAVFLSAIGGSRDPGAASTALAGILAIGWLVGVAVAVGRRSRTVRT
jgi:DnaJ domain